MPPNRPPPQRNPQRQQTGRTDRAEAAGQTVPPYRMRSPRARPAVRRHAPHSRRVPCQALSRRLAASGSPVRSLVAHPGIATTDLVSHVGGIAGALNRAMRFMVNDAEHGALPSLYAAGQGHPAGSYVGPDGIGSIKGPPGDPQALTRRVGPGDRRPAVGFHSRSRRHRRPTPHLRRLSNATRNHANLAESYYLVRSMRARRVLSPYTPVSSPRTPYHCWNLATAARTSSS
jgi:hypothetical protein